MCGLIEANLDLCRVPEDETEVVLSEAVAFLRRSKPRIAWDLVFFDPPYVTDYEQVLEIFNSRASDLLDKAGLFIAEHHHKTNLPEDIGNLVRNRILKQGDSSLSFYERRRQSP